MGILWDRFTGADERQRSQNILRDKIPAERGLSAETMAAVTDGQLEIDDDDPQAQKLRDLGNSR